MDSRDNNRNDRNLKIENKIKGEKNDKDKRNKG